MAKVRGQYAQLLAPGIAQVFLKFLDLQDYKTILEVLRKLMSEIKPAKNVIIVDSEITASVTEYFDVSKVGIEILFPHKLLVDEEAKKRIIEAFHSIAMWIDNNVEV